MYSGVRDSWLLAWPACGGCGLFVVLLVSLHPRRCRCPRAPNAHFSLPYLAYHRVLHDMPPPRTARQSSAFVRCVSTASLTLIDPMSQNAEAADCRASPGTTQSPQAPIHFQIASGVNIEHGLRALESPVATMTCTFVWCLRLRPLKRDLMPS